MTKEDIFQCKTSQETPLKQRDSIILSLFIYFLGSIMFYSPADDLGITDSSKKLDRLRQGARAFNQNIFSWTEAISLFVIKPNSTHRKSSSWNPCSCFNELSLFPQESQRGRVPTFLLQGFIESVIQ